MSFEIKLVSVEIEYYNSDISLYCNGKHRETSTIYNKKIRRESILASRIKSVKHKRMEKGRERLRNFQDRNEEKSNTNYYISVN